MFFFHCTFAQTPNSVPANGKVGIGTMTPNAKLQVKGCVKIDSSLTVNKSITVKENAAMKGDATFTGNVYLPTLVDTALTTTGVLMIDSTGKVVNGGALSSVLYGEAMNTSPQCLEDGNGNPIYIPPIWQHENHGMFLLEQNCHYSPRLGIGVKPSAKVQIRNTNPGIKPLLVEQWENGTAHKILQLDADGLLQAREVKVNLDNWPDYVFETDYSLPPLTYLEQFVEKTGHLPNVPSAETVKENGLNLGDAAKITMQKVEELTLYLIQLNKRVEQQGKVLKEQGALIQAQQKTIALQQKLIQELKEGKKHP